MSKEMRDLSVVKEESEAKRVKYQLAVFNALHAIGRRLFGEGRYEVEQDFGGQMNIWPIAFVLCVKEKSEILWFTFTSSRDIVRVSPDWSNKWLDTKDASHRTVVHEEFKLAGL